MPLFFLPRRFPGRARPLAEDAGQPRKRRKDVPDAPARASRAAVYGARDVCFMPWHDPEVFTALFSLRIHSSRFRLIFFPAPASLTLLLLLAA